MDEHYDMVMKARAEAGAATRHYFAYSTILDRASFEKWRSQHGYDFFDLPQGAVAKGLDVALSFDFPSRWWGGRVAGLADAPGASVWGRLFEISEKDWPIIQHKEGLIAGMSVERPVIAEVAGRRVEATAFATNPLRANRDGPVSQPFLDALSRGIEAAGLPGEWAQTVREFSSSKG